MRVTYCRELKAQALLKVLNIETFIPMQYVIGKNHKRELVPAIHNLIFVYTSLSVMKKLKKDDRIPGLQYMVDSKSRKKMIVPEKEMENFIAASASFDESLLYFEPHELNLKKGTRVRVCGGPFDGMEGIFMKVKGARDKRLVIAIPGVLAVAMCSIHPNLIEVIK